MSGRLPDTGHITKSQLGKSTGIQRLGSLTWIADATPVLSQAYVVRGLIGAGSLVLLYGDSNCGKSFFAIDLAMHIAGGRPWRNQRVNLGLCLYLACEGGNGIRNRMAAYRQEASWAAKAPFAMLPAAINLLDPDASTEPLIDLVHTAEETAGLKVAVIIVDTLARAMASGNENASEDMSAFIANVDRIRQETGAAVIVIHHCGKDTTKGARGHSSLRAACDTEILVVGQEGTRTAAVTKQRDLESGQRFGFDLVPVDIGADPEDGTAITSCVVAATDAPVPAKRRPSGERQQDILRMLEAERLNGNPIITTKAIIKLAKDRLGVKRTSANSAIQSLQKGGWIIPTVGGIKLNDG